MGVVSMVVAHCDDAPPPATVSGDEDDEEEEEEWEGEEVEERFGL